MARGCRASGGDGGGKRKGTRRDLRAELTGMWVTAGSETRRGQRGLARGVGPAVGRQAGGPTAKQPVSLAVQ